MSAGRAGRPAGLPKTGGRVKGTPNRATLALNEKLANLGCDPVEELVRLARLPDTPVNSKINIFSILLPYVHARRKPTADSEFVENDSASITPEEAVECAKSILDHYTRSCELQTVNSIQKQELGNAD